MNADKNLANGRVKREPSQRFEKNIFSICSDRSLVDLKRQPDGLSLRLLVIK